MGRDALAVVVRACRPWGEADERALFEAAGRLTVAELAAQIGRNVQTVQAHAKRLGVALRPHPGRRWTRQDDMRLLAQIETMSVAQIAKAENRSVAAVCHRLSKTHGVSTRQGKRTFADVCRDCGVSSEMVRRVARDIGIQARRKRVTTRGLTEKEEAALRAEFDRRRRARGLTRAALARETGTCRTHTANVCRALGIAVGRKHLTPGEYDRARRAVIKRARTSARLAAELGVAASTFARHAEIEGLAPATARPGCPRPLARGEALRIIDRLAATAAAHTTARRVADVRARIERGAL